MVARKPKAFNPLERGCLYCPLPGERIVKPEVGSGYMQGGLMIVGEGPGYYEDDMLAPFQGKAGQLLRKIIREEGYDPDDVIFNNAIRCRATDKAGKDREPKPPEVHACSYFLQKSIKKHAPKVIFALGNTATYALLGLKTISALRGCIFRFKDDPIFVVPSYHTSYLLRTNHFTNTYMKQFRSDFVQAVKLLKAKVPPMPESILVKTREKALFFLRKIAKQQHTALDVEGTKDRSVIYTIGLSLEDGATAVVFPFDHDESTLDFHNDKELREAFIAVLIGKVKKIGQAFNLYDRPSIEAFFGVRIQNFFWDTMFGSYVWDERRNIHDLSFIASRFLRMGGYDWEMEEYLTQHSLTKSELDKVPLPLIAKYNGRDACVTHMAAEKQQEKFNPSFKRLAKLYAYVSEPYNTMERLGVGFDLEYSRKLHVKYQREIKEMTRKIRHMAGAPDLNVNAPAQLGKIIFDKFKLHRKIPMAVKKELDLYTASGGWSTRDEVISRMAQELEKLKKPVKGGEIPKLLADYRDLTKDDGTFIVGLQELVNPQTGRIHLPLYLHGTDTGRASYRLHNIKKKYIYQWVRTGALVDTLMYTEDDLSAMLKAKKIRKKYSLLDQIIAAPGYVLVKADNSQIEMRVMAEMSGDPALIKLFQEDRDFHHETANFVFSLGCQYCLKGLRHPADESKWPHETKEQRTIAKNVNFGTAFGLDPEGLYMFLIGKIPGFSLTREQVADFWHKYYQRYKILRRWQKRTIQFAYENGYVEGLFGRRRHLDMYRVNDYGQEIGSKHAENQAINTPIQASAHDILLAQIAKLWEHRDVGYRMLFEQHDAVIFEVPEKSFKKCMAVIKDSMLNPDLEKWFGKKLQVPLKSDFESGEMYGALEEAA